MEAKSYMSRREIANLFECLMTGLMYHRPDNYVDYLIDCLHKIKNVGVDTVRWDMFLEAKRAKTPLPPIAPTNGMSREASIAASQNGDIKPSTPLPPIGSSVKDEVDGDMALKSNVPLFVVVGGPGCSKGSYCEALSEHFPGLTHISTGGLLREKAGQEHQEAIKKGELLPDDLVLSLLTHAIKAACEHTKGILLTGFPRSQSQVTLLKEKIGNVQQVLLIDYEEDDLMYTLERRRTEGGRDDDSEEASSRRVNIFKEQTLHVCKHFEDAGKLTLIDGNRSREIIIAEIAKILQNDFGEPTQVQVKFPSPRPPSVPRPSRRRPNQFDHETVQEEEDVEEFAGLRIRKVRLTDEDTGRRPGLTTSPIVLLMGGPGSGRSTQAAKLSAHYGFVHIDIDSCDGNPTDVLQRLRDLGDVKGIILEGYPASEQNLNDFNRVVGGVNLAILIDCYEDVLRQRCEAQERLQPYIDQEIAKFKENALCVVRHYDIANKLSIVLGDQSEEEIFSLITQAIDSKVLNKDSADVKEDTSAPAHDETDAGAPQATEEAVEEPSGEAPAATDATESAPAETGEEAPAEVIGEAPTEAAEAEAAEPAADVVAEAAEEDSAAAVEEPSEPAAEPAAESAAPAAESAEPAAESAAPAAEEEAPAAESAAPAAEEEAPAAENAGDAPTEAPAEPMPSEEAGDEQTTEEKPNTEEVTEDAEKTENGSAEAQEGETVPEAAAEPEQSPDEILKSLKVVFVIGGPGSGKGTQCEKILQNFQVGHVSTGDLMRAEVQSGSELGEKLKATMEKGELVTLDTVLQLLKAALVKMGKDKKCFLVDGYPREKEQGVRFENEVTECSVCLFFDVPNEVMTERLLKRGQSSGRVDDNEETIRARLKTFSDNTDPILEYFEGKGKLARIDATGTVDDIYSKVDKILEDAKVVRQ